MPGAKAFGSSARGAGLGRLELSIFVRMVPYLTRARARFPRPRRGLGRLSCVSDPEAGEVAALGLGDLIGVAASR